VAVNHQEDKLRPDGMMRQSKELDAEMANDTATECVPLYRLRGRGPRPGYAAGALIK
jgi:hypothetical protein